MSTYHTLLKFATPIIASQIGKYAAGFISMLFVAQLGKHELAAAALATMTFVIFQAIGNTFFNAIGIIIGHNTKHPPLKSAGTVLGNGLALSLLIGLIMATILWNMDKLLFLCGQDITLIHITTGYFHFASGYIIPLLLSTCIGQFYIGTGNPRMAFLYVAIPIPFTLFIAYGLVLGKWGLPIMGLGGIMCASLITQSIVCIVSILRLCHAQKYTIHRILQCKPLINIALCRDIIKLGSPIGIQFGSELIAVTIITYFMGWFGVDALAALQIVNQYYILLYMVYIGLSQSIAILTSQASANKDSLLVKSYNQTAIILMLVFLIIIAIIITLFSTPLIDIFLKSSLPDHLQITRLCHAFFIIILFNVFFDSVRNIVSGSYRGLQNTRMPMFIGIGALFLIGLPASYLFGFTLNLGPVGLRAGNVMGYFCAATYLIYRFYWTTVNHKCSDNG